MCSVSVIIPTYKHRDFILETLDSVFAQTFTDYEVIVINDGSPDDTGELLRPLAESGRIRYLNQENTGQSIARNRGIAEAYGEFIALLDDDDFWPPDKLEWQVAAMARYPDAGVIAGPASLIDASGTHLQNSPFTPEVFFEESFTGNPILSPGQALIRATVLKEVRGLNPALWGTDDWDLWLRIVKKSRIIMEDRTALFYRKHEGNASNNLCRMFDNCWLVLDDHLPDFDPEKRKRMSLLAYNWLYTYLGWKFALKIKDNVKSRDWRLAFAYTVRLAKLSGRLRSDPLAIKRIVKQVMPVKMAAYLFREPLY